MFYISDQIRHADDDCFWQKLPLPKIYRAEPQTISTLRDVGKKVLIVTVGF